MSLSFSAFEWRRANGTVQV